MGLAPSRDLAECILELYRPEGKAARQPVGRRPKPLAAPLAASPKRPAFLQPVTLACTVLGGAVLTNHAPGEDFRRIVTLTVPVYKHTAEEKLVVLRRVIDYVSKRTSAQPAELGSERIVQCEVPIAVDYVQVHNCVSEDLLAPRVLRISLYGHLLTHAL